MSAHQAPEALSPNESEARMLSAVVYFTWLAGFPVVGPIVVYAMRNQLSPTLAKHCVQAALLQLFSILLTVVFFIVGTLALLAFAPDQSESLWLPMVTVGAYGSAFLIPSLGLLLGSVVCALQGSQGRWQPLPLLGAWAERFTA